MEEEVLRGHAGVCKATNLESHRGQSLSAFMSARKDPASESRVLCGRLRCSPAAVQVIEEGRAREDSEA